MIMQPNKVIYLPLINCNRPSLSRSRRIWSQRDGGRGGNVIEVTRLDDNGPGTLRAAIEAEGPRIVVFRVGGTVELKKKPG